MRFEDLAALAGRSERQVELVCGLLAYTDRRAGACQAQLDHLRAERRLTPARLSSGADQAHLGELRHRPTGAGGLRGLDAACRLVRAYLPTGRA